MHRFEVLILIFLFTGCSTQKYYLTTNPDMINSYVSKKVNNGSLLPTNELYYTQNKVILIPTE